MRTSPTGSDGGFTLTELLVVLAIMALMVSLAPPLYRTIVPAARLKSASIEMLSFLRGARLEAVRTGEPVALTVLGGTITPSGEGAQSFEAPSGTEITFKPAFDAEGKGEDLTFFPDGSSSGGILNLGYGDTRRAISVNWLTGHVAMTQ